MIVSNHCYSLPDSEVRPGKPRSRRLYLDSKIKMSKECWPVECRLLKSLVFTVLVTNQGQVLLVSTHMGDN